LTLLDNNNGNQQEKDNGQPLRGIEDNTLLGDATSSNEGGIKQNKWPSFILQ
jgi:hypothetical protein